MKSIRSIPLVILLVITVLASVGCTEPDKAVPLIYSIRVPKSPKMISELENLEKSRRLLSSDRRTIEQDIMSTQRSLGVPEGLLWCLLFSKSQFDPEKNMNTAIPNKGLGQLTATALDEINYDRDYYDNRTSTYFKRHLHLGDSLVNLSTSGLKSELKGNSFQSSLASSAQGAAKIPNQDLELSPESYFRIPVGVFASAAYLNNRYQQLRAALDHLGVSYDPVILWFFAAAAYEGGMRPVYSVLTHELMSRGDRAVSRILSDMDAAHAFLTQRGNLEYSLRKVWPAETLESQLQSFTHTMDNVISCVLPESKT